MALASQTVRTQSMPRSSDSYNRRGGGGGGGTRSKQKRLVGIVLLAGLGFGLIWYATRHRDGNAAGLGGPASARAADSPATTDTRASAPGSGTLIAPDPLGHNAAVPPAAATPPNATLTMGNPGKDLPGGTLGTTRQPTNPTSAPTTLPPSPTPTPTLTDPSPAPAPAATNDLGAGVMGVATAAADRAMAQGKPLDARNILNRALLDTRSTATERDALRKRLAELNQSLVFGPAQTPGDPFSESYKVVAGDNPTKIARKLSLITEPSLIGRINKITNPSGLKVGQTLKVLRGPFHCVVDKSAFRMDIYAGATPSPSSLGTSNLPDNAEPGWTYICSFPVGLGEKGLTPMGNFTIKDGSKLINPHWANPRTGEKFAADDPKNPIGERWMGLEGLDEKSKAFTGYGIHGTIVPESIGHEMSMGCVRMNSADVEQVYELLSSRVSVVKIVP